MPLWSRPFILAIGIGTVCIFIALETGNGLGYVFAGMCYVGAIWKLLEKMDGEE